MEELKWPVDKCEGCGYDLRESTPKATEKANDENGKLIWNDHCPQCGKGHKVGDRVLPVPPAEVLAEREAQAILKKTAEPVNERADPEHQVTPGEVKTSEASGIPPDERGEKLAEENPDPEGQITTQATTPPEEKKEPEAIKPPGPGEYFCTKCASAHRLTSKIGKRHILNRE